MKRCCQFQPSSVMGMHHDPMALRETAANVLMLSEVLKVFSGSAGLRLGCGPSVLYIRVGWAR